MIGLFSHEDNLLGAVDLTQEKIRDNGCINPFSSAWPRA